MEPFYYIEKKIKKKTNFKISNKRTNAIAMSTKTKKKLLVYETGLRL